MNDNFDYITSTYGSFNDDVSRKLAVPPAAEWLLDNFYILEEQVLSI